MSESAIFKAAVKLAPERRAAYLDHTCGVNPELRREVESLLRAHDASGSFLQDPPARPQATVDDPPITEGPGTVIGPYKLLQQIGEGGMGVVYMAEQQEPVRRKVALKIIKPGMDSRQVIARFEAERQALAMMDHQNIAKVLDAGTTDTGRPYFVMELVHGIALTKYCDDNQLTPRQRLQLFVPICQAIQHAHQKGIIHRDLKPSNILVTMYDDKPVPKVIDFGVAKAVEQRLTEKTLFTQFGTLVGTFEYMSPEQAELNAFGVDTRSDIYSLGVLLYELLTGSTPLERQRLREAAYGEIVRLIKEEEPPRPSTRLSSSGAALAGISQQRGSAPGQLTQLVRGELDWIVMRCLEKDRTRRYETANSLARDVERYLKDEPVEACPPTAGYKLHKFARKNQKLLVTAAAFAALLLLGVVASTSQAVRATQAEVAANANAMQALEKEQEAKDERDEAQRQRDEVRSLNEKLQRTLYIAHMNLAKNAWDAGGTERVLGLLEQHRPKPGAADLRGFEWHYLNRLCHSDLLTLKHTSVRSVAFSPDGKRLASVGWPTGPGIQGEVKVWDAQTGRELLCLQGHALSVAFSPDGKRVASANQTRGQGERGGEVKVWDAQTGQELLSLQGGGGGVAFSPDGKRLASAGSGAFNRNPSVKVWDAQTGKELLSLQGGRGMVAFSPDGKRLVSGSGAFRGNPVPGEVTVWDTQTGQELLTLKGISGQVMSVVFSPDGKRLASGISGEGVKVWDAQTGQELLSLQGGGLNQVAFSPDGKRLACSREGRSLSVWDAQTGQEVRSFSGHTGLVNCIVFSLDGMRLASASLDQTVKIWDATTTQQSRTLSGPSNCLSVAYSPDGKRLFSANRDNTLKVWDAQTGQELLTFQGHTGVVRCVAFSPDGKRLASGDMNRTVKVWDAQTGRELLSLKDDFWVFGVAFSPDGKRLASGSKGVKVWDAQTGQELLSIQGGTGNVLSVAFSPDGKRLASGSADKTMKVWDAQTGQELLTLAGHADSVSSVAFSPDGKCLASASHDNTLKVWDAQTGQELLTLLGHTGHVFKAAFSPDGKRLASKSADNTMKVWDAQTGQETLTLKESTSGNSMAFSPDGQRLACVALDGTVKIWDATPLPERQPGDN